MADIPQFNWFSINDIQPVADLINKYVPHPSQFLLPGTNSAYVSTFAGDGFDWSAVRSQTGKDIYVVPNWQPSEDNAANSGVQGLFSWYAWPSENNRPVNKAMTIEADERYMSAVAGEEKVYMAPVSPWCKLQDIIPSSFLTFCSLHSLRKGGPVLEELDFPE